MATLVANAAVDMTDWDFDNIKNGTVDLHSSTKYTITGLAGGLHYEFTGSGLTYDGSNLLTGGTVVSFRVLNSDGTTALSINGFSMTAVALEAAIQSSDAGGAFENNVFSHANTITGSAFDDTLVGLSPAGETISGGGGNDIIIDFTTGNSDLAFGDTVLGGDGDDSVHLGGRWEGTAFDGGSGFDTAFFTGDYPLAFSLASNYFQNVEQFVLLNGPNYNFVLDDSVVADGANLRIDASNIGSGGKIWMDASDEVDGSYEFIGSGGTDIFRGGDQSDVFWFDRTSKDKGYGGDGDDTFLFGAAFGATDKVRGGAGADTLKLDGNYNLVITDSMLAGVESIGLVAGHDYTLTLSDDNNEDFLNIVGFALGAADNMVIDGSAETDSGFVMVDGGGDDTLTGGAQDDTFGMTKGGHNIVNGGGGDDGVVYISGNFNATEVINGGAGTDAVMLRGDYSGGIALGAGTLTSVETFQVANGFDYDVTFNDGNIAAGQTFTATAGGLPNGLTEDFSVRFDGSAELDGKFVMIGGAGRDTLIGGAQKDSLTGGGAADFLTGGAANDVFAYTAASDSTGRKFDTIDLFNATNEFIDVPVGVTGRDADVLGGSIGKATFDADLAAKADAAHLLANHAVLVKPSIGPFAGHTFLVIDQDGVAGYSVNNDIVIDMTGLIHAVDLSVATFV